MSSTNRSDVRPKDDYFITPGWIISSFLTEFRKDYPQFKPQNALDCCAGGDPTNPKMPYVEAIRCYFPECSEVSSIDIREDSSADIKGDYLKMVRPEEYLEFSKVNPRFDLIISNPPFLLAEEFINKAIWDITPEGRVMMLLRLNFFGAQKRKAFFDRNMPTDCYISSKRPSFTGGKTDSTEYAHFVWAKKNPSGVCRTRVL